MSDVKSRTADRAITTALLSIDADRKQAEREERFACGNAVVAGMMERVRATRSEVESMEREADARLRREKLARTRRGQRMLAERAAHEA